MIMLRDFLYLNEDQVEQYVSALEGGALEEHDVETTDHGRSVHGSAGIPGTGVSIGGSSGSESRRELRRFRQNSAGQFQRVYRYLEETNELWSLAQFDKGKQEPVKRHRVIEEDVRLQLSELTAIAQSGQKLGQWMKLLQDYAPDTDFSESDLEQLEFLNEFAQAGSPEGIPIKLLPQWNSDWTLVAYLDSNWLRISADQLSGEATVLGTVRRTIPPGATEDLFDFEGTAEVLTMNRHQRRKAKKKETPEQLRFVVNGPAILVNPVALYR